MSTIVMRGPRPGGGPRVPGTLGRDGPSGSGVDPGGPELSPLGTGFGLRQPKSKPWASCRGLSQAARTVMAFPTDLAPDR